MTAVAHFSCCPNSYPFQDRHISLSDPVKIGRSVARCKPSTSNAVFDCKVLSRNHALLWFENGKFYLQDTKSSNGTFVNNQRLSKASEESPAIELNSCDVVQFGVDVVDNARKVTHGCIVSQLRLYLPNGEEAKQSNCSWTNKLIEKVPFSQVQPSVQAQDLYQLHQYLQEALHREQMLEQKLALLQRLVITSHDASEKGWQALIDEDRLLSRLEFLENQLQAFNKGQTDDSLQTQLQQVQEEKYNYENTSKETLRQALQEKLEAARKLASVERSLSNTEDECTHLRTLYEQTQTELKSLSTSHQTKLQELSSKLQDAEHQHAQLKASMEKENYELQNKIDELLESGQKQLQTIETLQAENEKLQEIASQIKDGDTTDPDDSVEGLKSQLTDMEAKLDQLHAEKLLDQEKRILAEEELLKLQEEKERQNIALTETSKELQAALNDRENLMQREENVRSVVEESERILQLCESTSRCESDESDDETEISSPSLVIVKAKLKELHRKLRKADQHIESLQLENNQLKEKLESKRSVIVEHPSSNVVAVEDSSLCQQANTNHIGESKAVHSNSIASPAEKEAQKALKNIQFQQSEFNEAQDGVILSRLATKKLNHLQDELNAAQSSVRDREEDCRNLTIKLERAEKSFQTAGQELGLLKNKLAEEQATATKQTVLAEELRIRFEKQALHVDKIEKQEKESTQKLNTAVEKLNETSNQMTELQHELEHCYVQKSALESEIGALADNLVEAEKEKLLVQKDLQVLEDETVRLKDSLKQEIGHSEALTELSAKEQARWENALQLKDTELQQASAQYIKLSIEHEEKMKTINSTSYGRWVVVMAIILAFIPIFYFYLFNA
ncbi:unnamed protein product [Clavelina lepadiformis]|uniref:FHA domain-containing protein n=1 Tax=Clavelina lepadiformis TaxID=159417 RepID=A0ABP0GQ51_CLALP